MHVLHTLSSKAWSMTSVLQVFWLTSVYFAFPPFYIYRQWLGNEVNSIYTDEAHSNGTVQDFHLIPFSSVSSQAEVAETKHCKCMEKNLKCKSFFEKRCSFEKSAKSRIFFYTPLNLRMCGLRIECRECIWKYLPTQASSCWVGRSIDYFLYQFFLFFIVMNKTVFTNLK